VGAKFQTRAIVLALMMAETALAMHQMQPASSKLDITESYSNKLGVQKFCGHIEIIQTPNNSMPPDIMSCNAHSHL